MTKLEKAHTIGFDDLSYETQWLVFNKAKMFGWSGRRPGILGTFSSDRALDDALEYLMAQNVVKNEGV